MRLEVVLLAATMKVTYPLPLPDALAGKVNQLKALDDDQEQPLGAVTAVVNPPPAAMVEMLVGLIE